MQCSGVQDYWGIVGGMVEWSGFVDQYLWSLVFLEELMEFGGKE